jgi:hypothetical protein
MADMSEGCRKVWLNNLPLIRNLEVCSELLCFLSHAMYKTLSDSFVQTESNQWNIESFASFSLQALLSSEQFKLIFAHLET